MKMELAEKVVLVTGGSRGLGFVLAREFGRRGAKVAICARDAMELEAAREEIASEGIDVLAVPCDVRDREGVGRMIAEVVDHYGRIDVVVNNAGIIAAGPVEAQRIEDIERLMDVLFWGTVHVTLAALPELERRKTARIANITSIGGKLVSPHMLSYNAAKFAAVGFSEALRADLADTNVKVTTVVPGFMRTGGYQAARFKGDAENEAAIFGALSNAPLISMDAERAGRKIVDAIVKGEAEIVVGLSAKLAMWVNGVAPGLTSRMMGLVERAMPQSADPKGKGVKGEDLLPENKTVREFQRH